MRCTCWNWLSKSAGLIIDTRELNRNGASYMVDTLKSLRQEFKDEPLLVVYRQLMRLII